MHICEGTISAEWYAQVLVRHIRPFGKLTLLEVFAYFSEMVANHILHLLQHNMGQFIYIAYLTQQALIKNKTHTKMTEIH